jgi:hypothetical protein
VPGHRFFGCFVGRVISDSVYGADDRAYLFLGGMRFDFLSLPSMPSF